MMQWPTGFEQPRRCFVPQIVEVEIDGAQVGACLRREPAVLPDRHVAVRLEHRRLPTLLDAHHRISQFAEHERGAWIFMTGRVRPRHLERGPQSRGDREY